MKFSTFFLLVFFSSFAVGNCLDNDEYKKKRTGILKESRELNSSYKECRESAYNNAYWKAVSECALKGLGKDIGGGCGHMVGQGAYPMQEPDKNHCEIFHIPKEVVLEYRQQLIDELELQKCET
ncbi:MULTISPECIES: hypothetical protein [Pseudoalteromonas]|uniref:Uncharacterized protein n=1 Tax=Pseudoalteromonas obscura TaxID=3048491 RepID=A0ABT7EG65_9GAMM|nr:MULTISPECIES: hypothetical protein [Pseudoalteromonas]MBQ4835698.1 hypothetical protein [Pseudoalteromonas luteoviolacea]MDK2594049.1 hypothetical protein [Pseudoalteromonas sp. P94(2023)]